MTELTEFLRLMLAIAPDAAALVHQAIEAWDGQPADKDALRQILPSKFQQIDSTVDQAIKDLNLPSKENP